MASPPPTSPPGSSRGNGGPPPLPENPQRWADLLLVGLLLILGLWARLLLADSQSPGLSFAIGPDGDDWAGVFQGAANNWPPAWEGEWSYKYPLLPMLALPLHHLLQVPMAFAAQMVTLCAGALLAPLTYLLGARSVGRAAALAAAGWMGVQDGLTSHAVLTTAYALVPTCYLFYLLGMSQVVEGRRRLGASLAVLGAWGLCYTLLHGTLLLFLTTGAALLALLPDVRRHGWRSLAWLMGPGLLGFALARLALLPFVLHQETPIRGAVRHIYEEVRQTLFHDPRFGVPTGHQVERLLHGMNRLDHLAATQWDLFSLPLPMVAAGVVLGVIVLLRTSGPGQFTRRWLLWLAAGMGYAFVGNSEDFHVFQWFPCFALLLCAGWIGWPSLLPTRRAAWRNTAWWKPAWWSAALAVAFLYYQGVIAPAAPRLAPGQRYTRINAYYRENLAMRDACVAVSAPLMLGGTLLVDQPHLWAYRAHLRGPATRIYTGWPPDFTLDPTPLQPPILLASGREQQELASLFQRPVHLLPVLELANPAGTRLYRVQSVSQDAPAPAPPPGPVADPAL